MLGISTPGTPAGVRSGWAAAGPRGAVCGASLALAPRFSARALGQMHVSVKWGESLDVVL